MASPPSSAVTAEAFLGAPDNTLPSPSFCVHVDVARSNTKRMMAKAAGLGLRLRPHVKTHKTLEGAALQTAGEASGIVVSTVAEARAFVSSGFNDVLYGVGVEPSKLSALWDLHVLPGVNLRVMLDSHEALTALVQFHEARGGQGSAAKLKPWMVYLKLDCGYRRAGVVPTCDAAVELARAIAAGPRTSLWGIYSHSGHSYNCCPKGSQTAREAAAGVGAHELQEMLAFARRLRAEAGLSVPVISVGATPSVSAGDYALAAAATDLPGTSIEVHPGNYIFFDRQQRASGSCSTEDIAGYVLSRVVGRYPERNEFLIDAGSCALHKDSGGLKCSTWGELLDDPTYVLVRMTQEAAVVTTQDGSPVAWDKFPLGGVVRVLPNHACMTASGHPVYYAVSKSTDGVRKVEAVWRPVKWWY